MEKPAAGNRQPRRQRTGGLHYFSNLDNDCMYLTEGGSTSCWTQKSSSPPCQSLDLSTMQVQPAEQFCPRVITQERNTNACSWIWAVNCLNIDFSHQRGLAVCVRVCEGGGLYCRILLIVIGLRMHMMWSFMLVTTCIPWNLPRNLWICMFCQS